MRVSIVISTHNLESVVDETLEAALAQTHPSCEVVVVDDGSTDRTREVLGRYRDRVRLVLQENFGGPSRPRNVGVRESTGDLVAFCDGDDVLRPDAIAAAVEIFQNHPDIDVVWANLEYRRDSDGASLGLWTDRYEKFRSAVEPTSSPSVYRMSAESAYEWLIRGLHLGLSSVVVRRTALDRVGPFDEQLRNGDDRDMWLRLARTGHVFAYRDQVAFMYRIRAESIGRRGYKRIPAMMSVLERQLPYVQNPELQNVLRSRIGDLRLSYAHGLRRAGHTGDARSVYWNVLRHGAVRDGIRGLILATLRLGSGNASQ